MKPLYLFFAFALAGEAFAQHGQRAYEVLADSLYKHHNYKEATNYYERAIKNAKEPGNVMLKLARSFTEMKSVKEAEAWYEKARANKALFSTADTYYYVKELIMLERRTDAEMVLSEFLHREPDATFARELLTDLQHVNNYLADSARHEIVPLAINTEGSEFAPAYYKNGLVFTSARPQFFSKKRYHWDNTPFLNLYFAEKITDQKFQNPIFFEKRTNTRLHDGPASFYANSSRMMLNRNVSNRMEASADIYISHLTIFDVSLNKMKKGDELNPLPFEHGAYSFAHPHISEDGNTLYFVSDKPGGYGGTDIYVAHRQNGIWSKPLNVGPSINSPQNETFPFFLDNILYFSSDGHYGLGGMDIFKSKWSTNGFAPPVNLGYSINSHLDDFSLITKDHKSGYFASSRKGNDDLFSFTIQPKIIHLLARLSDGVTNESLSEGIIQLLRNEGGDLTLTSGKGGKISFELPDESPFILLAEKDGKSGVLSGIATTDQDFEHVVHQLPVFGDSSSTTCVINLKNESGKPQNVSSAIITDQTTGEKSNFTVAQSLLTFQGKKGHQYHVEIQSEFGNINSQNLNVEISDTKIKTLNITVKDSPELIAVAVRVLEEGSRSPIVGCKVQVASLAAPDQEVVTDEKGYATFSLSLHAAYLVMALKDSLAGMSNGFAEKDTTNSNVDTIYLKKQAFPPTQAMALIKNAKGETLVNAHVTVTDEATGQEIPLKGKNGLLLFFGEPNKKYVVRVTHEGYDEVIQNITLAHEPEGMNRLSIVLPDVGNSLQQLAIRVVNEKDKSSIAGARVEITRFSLPDIQSISDEAGLVYFSVPEGEAYFASASKDGLTGAYVGVADSATVTRSIMMGQESGLPVNGKVTDSDGAVIPEVLVDVTDNRTGSKVQAQLNRGMINFRGEVGAKYNITVSASNYGSVQKTVSVTSSAPALVIPTFTLSKKIPVEVKIGDNKSEILKGALVRVIDEATHQPVDVMMNEGKISFLSEQGKSYRIVVEHDDYNTVEDALIVPLHSEKVEPVYISLSKKSDTPPSHLIKARVLKASDSTAFADTDVKIVSFSSDDIDLKSAQDGSVEFTLPEGSAYVAFAGKAGDYYGVYSGVSEKDEEINAVIHPIYLKKEPGVPVFGFVSDAAQNAVSNATAVVTDKNTKQPMEVRIENGIVIFNAQPGAVYLIEVTAEGYEVQGTEVSIPAEAPSIHHVDITVSRKKLFALPAKSHLVIVNNENPRVYITSENSLDEIVEVDGQLYVENKEGRSLIGKGSIQEVLLKPSYLIDFANDQKINIDNVYFDYNSILLDEADQQVLSKVEELFSRYPVLKVHVSAHADTRGSANYNLALTNKRASTIKRYLVKHGVPGRHVSTKAHGKNKPVVICETKECTKLQHQRNRRAEFELSVPRKIRSNSVLQQQDAIVNPPARVSKIASYDDVLNQYGNVQVSELVFKICIGAYRLNPNMKFSELSDLGTVTQHERGNINFYFLQSYPTMNKAEAVRKKVIERGIRDAYITYFYKHKLISFKQFAYLAK